MSSGREIVAKIGSFPFLRRSTRSRKFKHISESLKQHWISVPASFYFAVFDPSTKTNFEGETLYKARISVTASDFRIWKISDSRIFFWVSSEHIMWPSNDLRLIRAEWFSSRDLCQTPLIRELFKPSEFGSMEPNNLPLKVASYIFDEGIYISLHPSMAAKLRLGIAASKSALVHLKRHLFLMMYFFWWLSVEVCHLQV